MNYKILPVVVLFALGFMGFHAWNEKEVEGEVAMTVKVEEAKPLEAEETFEMKMEERYADLDVQEYRAPSKESFQKALKGFWKMKEEGILKKDILTIVDFSLSSTARRLWVIDMSKNKILLQTVVSHGRNSGNEFAQKFSNTINSNMSSLGFYKTGETYSGKHGFSLRLDGLEKGYNDLARERAIVMHGADYAAESLAQKQGRLGRSLGCPAIPQNIKKELIDLIKDETCLFIYYPNSEYLKGSQFLS